MRNYHTKLTGYVSGLFLRGFDADEKPLMRAALCFRPVPDGAFRKFIVDLQTQADVQTASDAMLKGSRIEMSCECDDANIVDETATSYVQSYEYIKRLPVSDYWGVINEKDVA